MKNTAIHFILLSEVDSTNNYANRLILSDKAEEGAVVLAHYQKTGRGLGQNFWESERDKNLLASIILFPDFLPAGKQFYISKITSLAIVDLLTDKTDQVSVKWPNDIYFQDKKLAGILIENAVQGNYLVSSILGIGININQTVFYSDAPNPVSLKQITGLSYEVLELAEMLAMNILDWYEKLKNGQLQEIDEQYFANMYRKNQWAMFKRGNQQFEARIVGTGEFGQLVLENREGDLTSYMFKEIEFVL